jgi:type VI secretion system protein
MFQDRLLERISRIERDPSGRDALPVAWEVRSITRHLQRLLNTRQGGVPIAEDYGIPDFTNIPGETLTETAQEMVKVQDRGPARPGRAGARVAGNQGDGRGQGRDPRLGGDQP